MPTAVPPDLIENARELTRLLGTPVPLASGDLGDVHPSMPSYKKARSFLDDTVHIVIDDLGSTIEISPPGAPFPYLAIGDQGQALSSVMSAWPSDSWPSEHIDHIVRHIDDKLAQAKLMSESERAEIAEASLPTEYSRDEVQALFLQHARAIVKEWGDYEGKTPEERISGAVFSLLAVIDGSAADLPGFVLAPDPHPDDAAFRKGRGERWFPAPPEDACDISGGLHELF